MPAPRLPGEVPDLVALLTAIEEAAGREDRPPFQSLRSRLALEGAAITPELRAELAALVARTKREHRAATEQVEMLGRERPLPAPLRAELDELRGLRDRLDLRAEALAAELELILAQGAAALQQVTAAAIRGFVEEQALAPGAQRAPVTLDLRPLAGAIGQAVRAQASRSASAVEGSAAEALAACAAMCLGHVAGAEPGSVRLGLPFIPPLERPILALAPVRAPLWAFWRRRRIDPARTAEALRRRVLAELLPWSQRLLLTVTEAQAAQARAGRERLQQLLAAVDAAIEDRSARLRGEGALRARLGADPQAARLMAHRLQSRIEVLERRLQRLAVAEAQLRATGFEAA